MIDFHLVLLQWSCIHRLFDIVFKFHPLGSGILTPSIDQFFCSFATNSSKLVIWHWNLPPGHDDTISTAKKVAWFLNMVTLIMTLFGVNKWGVSIDHGMVISHWTGIVHKYSLGHVYTNGLGMRLSIGAQSVCCSTLSRFRLFIGNLTPFDVDYMRHSL